MYPNKSTGRKFYQVVHDMGCYPTPLVIGMSHKVKDHTNIPVTKNPAKSDKPFADMRVHIIL